MLNAYVIEAFRTSRATISSRAVAKTSRGDLVVTVQRDLGSGSTLNLETIEGEARS